MSSLPKITESKIAIHAKKEGEKARKYWSEIFCGSACLVVVDSLGKCSGDNFDLVVINDSQELAPEELLLLEKMASDTTHFLVVVGSGDLETPSLCDLLGAEGTIPIAHAEWYLKSINAQNQPIEVAIYGKFHEIMPKTDTTTLASISVGYRDRPALIGRGNIFTFGVDIDLDQRVQRQLSRAFKELIFKDNTSNVGPFGVGVAGYGPYGGMGHYHGSACNATPHLKFVAIAEPNQQRRNSAKEQFPKIQTYESAKELIEDDEVDIVIIATPPITHFELASQALKAKKHVVVEKPMCLKVSEVDELIELARLNNVVLTIHQNRRFDADYLALKELIESGTIGEVFNIETFVGSFEHPCRAWHSDQEISGGAAYDWGSHHIDWILQFYGTTPSHLFVNSHKRVWHDVTNADQITISMAFQDGKEAKFIQSDVAAIRKPKFYVQGTKGTIQGWYRPLANDVVDFPFGYRSERFHHAEAPVDFEVVQYAIDNQTRSYRVSPTEVEPFEFHRNLAAHLVNSEPLAIVPSSVRGVIEILEATQRLSNSKEHYVQI